MLRLKGRIALVTGAGSGIGEGAAHMLAEEGATSIVADINLDAAKNTASKINAAGGNAVAMALDVTREDDWTSCVNQVTKDYGKLDILVNCAGIFSETGQPFEGIPYEEWKKIMAINLDGTFLGCKAAVIAMKETGGGSIINIGSYAGLKGSPAGAGYGTSKGAVSILSKHVAYSCAAFHYNIRVNTIHPGHVWTPANARKSIGKYGTEEAAKKAVAALNPMGVLGEPADIGHLIVYLASDDSRMMNGSDLLIDGGRLSC